MNPTPEILTPRLHPVLTGVLALALAALTPDEWPVFIMALALLALLACGLSYGVVRGLNLRSVSTLMLVNSAFFYLGLYVAEWVQTYVPIDAFCRGMVTGVIEASALAGMLYAAKENWIREATG